MVLLAAFLLAQDSNAVALSSLLPGTTLGVSTEDGKPRLVLTQEGKEPVAVKKPDDLKDQVRIGTEAQALEFVRFLRTPGVWPFLFDKPVVEIRRQPVLFRVPKSLYNDLRIYTVSGWDGVLNDRDWTRFHFEEPKVTGGNGKDWSIRRPCLVREGEKYKVGTLNERVSDSGRYVFNVERPEDAPRGASWQITGKALPR